MNLIINKINFCENMHFYILINGIPDIKRLCEKYSYYHSILKYKL